VNEAVSEAVGHGGDELVVRVCLWQMRKHRRTTQGTVLGFEV
jgi:hypothetical protein